MKDDKEVMNEGKRILGMLGGLMVQKVRGGEVSDSPDKSLFGPESIQTISRRNASEVVAPRPNNFLKSAFGQQSPAN